VARSGRPWRRELQRSRSDAHRGTASRWPESRWASSTGEEFGFFAARAVLLPVEPKSSARKSSEAAGTAKLSLAGRPTCKQSGNCPSEASSRTSRAGGTAQLLEPGKSAAVPRRFADWRPTIWVVARGWSWSYYSDDPGNGFGIREVDFTFKSHVTERLGHPYATVLAGRSAPDASDGVPARSAT
jgi:hypothetical protein